MWNFQHILKVAALYFHQLMTLLNFTSWYLLAFLNILEVIHSSFVSVINQCSISAVRELLPLMSHCSAHSFLLVVNQTLPCCGQSTAWEQFQGDPALKHGAACKGPGLFLLFFYIPCQSESFHFAFLGKWGILVLPLRLGGSESSAGFCHLTGAHCNDWLISCG